MRAISTLTGSSLFGFGAANSGDRILCTLSPSAVASAPARLLLLSGEFSPMQLLPLNKINKQQLVIKSENICFHFDGYVSVGVLMIKPG